VSFSSNFPMIFVSAVYKLYFTISYVLSMINVLFLYSELYTFVHLATSVLLNVEETLFYHRHIIMMC